MKKKETALLTEEVLQELYLTKNLTVKEIASQYNLGTATVNRLLKQHNLQKSEESRRAAIAKTKQSKTDEEKLLYSKHISEARKGKGRGIAPWNKGTKGLQVAWNKGISMPGRPRTPESLEKARQTCLQRYGVDWACQRPAARLKGQNSAANVEFEELLKEHHIQYTREFPIGSYSYDFKVGDYLIEIDPYATHNSTWGIRDNPPKSSSYHKQKSDLAKREGYFCIHKFDWDEADKLISLLQPRVFVGARQCQVKEVTKEDAKEFIDSTHLQNYAKDLVRLGLYYKNQLVSIMTFGKPRYNTKCDYQLIRHCATLNIAGGAEKLFKYFVDAYQPTAVISYCDEAKFSGNTYIKLGFKLIRNGRPAKHWYNPKTKQHITDNLLRQRGFDQLFNTNYGKGTSNEALMLKAGFVEVYDCGQATYVWQQN